MVCAAYKLALFGRLLGICLAICGQAALAQQNDWIKQDEGFWFLPKLLTEGEDGLSVSAFRINRLFYEYELRVSEEILRDHDVRLKKEKTVQEYFDSGFHRDDYSLRNIWMGLREDPSVVGVVPVGYVEVEGQAIFAGFLRVNKIAYNGLISAPHLNALWCLNNERFRTGGAGQPFDGQAPWIFGVQPDPAQYYRYIERSDAVLYELTKEVGALPEQYDERSEGWFKASFSGLHCEDMVQVGPRLLESDVFPAAEGANRLALDRDSKVDAKPRKVLALSYDLNGHLTFTVSNTETQFYDMAQLISSDVFYPHGCTWQSARSASCELWAVALTAWDHAGMILRDPSDPNNLRRLGQRAQNVPAVIVIKKRGTPGQPRDADEVRINTLGAGSDP